MSKNMKYNIGHLSFKLLSLLFMTMACYSFPAFSQESKNAARQDTVRSKSDDRKYLQTSAVSTINYSDLDKASVSNLENALTGKASGLTVLRKSGDEPGNSLSDIYIRGIGTYGQFRSPLFLVDDVERDISQMDIEEIESVSILKDGAANARYGQRGANGTVFVTTKRGIVGKPEISLTAQYGFQQPARLPDFLSSREYVSLYNKALQNDGMSVPSDDRYNPEMYNGTQNPYLFPDVDWYSSFLKDNTPQQQYKVSVRGGTEQVKYFVLFSFLGKNGLYKYSDVNSGFNTNVNYNRYNIRSNIDAAVTKSLDISLDLAGRIEDKNMPNSSSSDIFNVLSTIAPNAMPIVYEDGKIAGTSQYRQNPYGMISHTGYRKDRNKVLQVKAQARQRLDIVTKGLDVRVMVAFDGVSGYGTGKTSNYATYELQRDNTYSVYGEDKQLSLAQEKLYDYYQYRLAFDAGFSYERTFGKHEVLADMRYYQSQLFVQGDNPAYARQGMSGKATYCFDKRYVGEFSFAYDGSDEYAPGHRFGFFPSVSGAWIISNESFFNRNVVNYLKFRASYGEAGNCKTGFERYAYQSHWSGFDQSYGGYIFGSGFAWSDGAWEGRLANPDLTWETTRNVNVGIDFELFSKLSVSVDAFWHKRTDIVSEKQNTSSWIIGAPFPYVNIGTVVNRGMEASLTHNNRINKFGYFVQANISLAKNKILAMDEVEGLKEYQKRTGKSVSQLWGLEALGFYMNEEDIRNSPISTFYKIRPGDLKYKNQNSGEDNHINSYDEVPIGKPTVPEITMGLSLGIDYAGFDFSAMLSGVANRSVYLNNAAVWALQNNNKVTALAYGAWEKGVREADATFPRLTTENNLNNYRSSSFWIKNGNFLRLSNVEIGYQLPESLLKKVNIKQLRLYVNGQNLLTVDKLGKYDVDPEVVDAGVTGYPVKRSLNIGVNQKF